MHVLFCHLPGGNEYGKTASSALPLLAFIKEESKKYSWLFVKPRFQNIILSSFMKFTKVGLKIHTACEFCMGTRWGHHENCCFAS